MGFKQVKLKNFSTSTHPEMQLADHPAMHVSQSCPELPVPNFPEISASFLAALQGAAAAAGGLRDPQNLLTLRKISVARMHSLPNDSYMFRPVMPAKPPFPLHEGELEAFSYRSPRGKASGSGPAEFSANRFKLQRVNNFQRKTSSAVAWHGFEDRRG